MKKYTYIVLILSLAIVSFCSAQSNPTTIQLFGRGWSDSVGWVKFNNCSGFNTDTKINTGCIGPTYNVSYNTSTGDMAGYAWSSNVGWISFNQSDRCINSASIKKTATGFAMTGSARVMSMTNTEWASPTRNGGWDGCIYFDTVSMPNNSCKIAFSPVFNRNTSANLSNKYGEFDSTGGGWSAGGANPVTCADSLNVAKSWNVFGWLKFDVVPIANRLKFYSIVTKPSIISFSVVTGSWNPSCQSSNTNSISLQWESIDSGGCELTYDGQHIKVPANSSNYIIDTLSPSTGKTFDLTCTDGYIQSDTVSITSAVCSQCSDATDNDGDGDIDVKDKNCYKKCDPNDEFIISNTESASCDKKPIKGIPSFREE